MTTPNDLWYRAGENPALLPTGTVFDSTNTSWSLLAENPEGREALGFIKAPAWPAYNAETQTLDWDAETAKWVKVAIPPPPAPDVEGAKVAALAKLASDRWDATQTFTYDGVEGVPADPAVGILTARLTLMREAELPDDPAVWKLRGPLGDSPTAYRMWSKADLIAYGLAIAVQIQTCFNLEAQAAAAVMAASTIEAVQAATNVAWPTGE